MFAFFMCTCNKLIYYNVHLKGNKWNFTAGIEWGNLKDEKEEA